MASGSVLPSNQAEKVEILEGLLEFEDKLEGLFGGGFSGRFLEDLEDLEDLEEVGLLERLFEEEGLLFSLRLAEIEGFEGEAKLLWIGSASGCSFIRIEFVSIGSSFWFWGCLAKSVWFRSLEFSEKIRDFWEFKSSVCVV